MAAHKLLHRRLFEQRVSQPAHTCGPNRSISRLLILEPGLVGGLGGQTGCREGSKQNRTQEEFYFPRSQERDLGHPGLRFGKESKCRHPIPPSRSLTVLSSRDKTGGAGDYWTV